MALKEITLNWPQQGMPAPPAQNLIDDAQERIERFIRARQASDPIPSFVACDFVMVDRAIRAVAEQRLAPGPVFCEWGAGFAVAAGLAALNGLGAYAIEIHRDLVDQADRLLRDHSIEVELAQGSLVPEGGDEIVDEMDTRRQWVLGLDQPLGKSQAIVRRAFRYWEIDHGRRLTFLWRDWHGFACVIRRFLDRLVVSTAGKDVRRHRTAGFLHNQNGDGLIFKLLDLLLDLGNFLCRVTILKRLVDQLFSRECRAVLRIDQCERHLLEASALGVLRLVEDLSWPILDEFGDNDVLAGLEGDGDLVVSLLMLGVVVLVDELVVDVELKCTALAELEFDFAFDW